MKEKIFIVLLVSLLAIILVTNFVVCYHDSLISKSGTVYYRTSSGGHGMMVVNDVKNARQEIRIKLIQTRALFGYPPLADDETIELTEKPTQ